MKKINHIISLLMVALILTTSVPFTYVSAVDVGTENYTLNMEKTYADSSLAESSAVGGMSFFGRTEFDGCYGNQLLGVAREIYDSLVENYTTEKITGEYTYAFETPFTFDAEISGSSIVMNDEFEAVELEIQYAVQAAMDAFLYDHPEVFWLKIISTAYGISASGNDVIGYTGIIDDITIIPTEIYSGASSKLSQYESAVDGVIDAIAVTESRYETLKNIHDYICNNAWYNLVDEQRVHSSEPFFIGDGGVVCEGYAKTFKILCDRLEIPCTLVSGDAGGAHMWNYVQMDDGRWYLIDATWDDQESKIYDTYFLANANTIGFNDVAICEERTERSDFSGTGIFSFTYPVLSATAYTVHVHEWDSDYTVDVEPTCTEKGSKSIHCKTCDETKSVSEVPIIEHTYENYICIVCGSYDESNLLSFGKCGDDVYYTLDNKGHMRVFGVGEMYDYRASYTTPWAVNGNLIKNVEFDSEITHIGDYAFWDCNSLTNITIPYNITSIGIAVFDYCRNLEIISVDENNKNYSSDKSGILFNEDKTKLVRVPMGYDEKSYSIPKTVTYIDYGAFLGCEEIENIELHEGIEYIADRAFYGCSSITSITIPSKVKSIGEATFHYCYNLVSITMGKNITNVGDYAFYDCKSLKTIHYLGTPYDWDKINIGLGYGEFGKIKCHFCKNMQKVNETCENDGFEAGWYCNDCQNYIVGGKVIDKLGHSFSNIYTIDKKPTCTTKGSKSQHCVRVGCTTQINIVSIPMTDHNNKIEQLKQDATCSSVGYTSGVYCLDCEKWIEGHEEIKKLSHTFISYTSDCNATCLADGTKTAVCDVCNKAKDTVTDEGSKDNAEHKYSIRAGSSATCTEDGERIYVCDVCETATYTETIPATGKHSFVACLGEDPTCTEDGFVEYCCEICETETYRETVPATGHDYDSVVIVPTCTAKGYTTHTCTVCGESYTDTYVNAKGHKGGTATCKNKAECTVCGKEYGSINADNHKSLVTLKAVTSTCSKTGLTEGSHCSVCKAVIKKQNVVAKKAHTYKTTVTKATLSKNGKTETKCTVCGYISKTTVIYAPKTVKLSATSYTYNGKVKTPSVTVKDSKGKKLKNGTDYTVKYSKGRKSIGKYTVTVTFKGNYSGTKKLTFEIVPAKVTLSKLTVGSKALTATWKTVSGATGYEVQYSTSKKFTSKTTRTVKIKSSKTKKTTIKKLTKGKKYYVRIRAYKTVSKKPVYGAWSSVKNIKVK